MSARRELAFLLAVTAVVLVFDAGAVTFTNCFDESAVKSVVRDVTALLKDMEGHVDLRKDETLAAYHWALKSGGTALAVSGRDGQAVIYGLYTYLEKHLGFRWYAPDVTKTPDLRGKKFPVVDEQGHCAYEYFNTSARPSHHGGEPLDGLWLLRNKHSCDTAFDVGCHQGAPCGVHTFPKYAAEIRKTHPELFGVKPAAAKGKKCETLCLTDPLVRELAAEQMIKYIEKDRARGKRPSYSTPVIYDFAQEDGAGGDQCMCESCKAMAEREGSYAGPNIDFCNAVARIVNRKYPEVKVRTLAYAYVADPPKTVVADKNVIVRFCRAWLFDSLVPGTKQAKDLENWSKHAKTLGIWSYWRTYRGQLYPFIKKRADIEAELRFCHLNNARHYYAEDEAAAERSFAMMQFWLLFKMCEDPYQPIAPLAQEFLAAYYGKAAGAMEKYLDYLESREEVSQTYLDRAFYEKVNAWLDEAERLVADDAVSLRHVRWERTVVDRSMYDRLAGLLKQGYVYDREKVASRFEPNAADVLKNWTAWKNPKFRDSQEQRLRDLKQEAALYARYPIPMPKIFDGLEVLAMDWNQISIALGKVTYVEDPKAAAGTSFRIEDREMKLPYEFGMYHNQRKEGDSVCLYREDIPQDGEFHCYRVGTAVIQQPLYVFFHGSWRPRTYLRTLGIIPETRDVWISARFQGPTFVEGSTEPHGVFIDRMFLVKGTVLDLYEKPTAEPVIKGADAAFGGTERIWNSASLGDPAKMENDIYVRGRLAYEGVQAGQLPFGGLRCLDAKGKTVFTIPVATFYLGNDEGRNFEAVVTAQRIRSRLKKRDGTFVPPCTLHFSGSVPADSSATVRMSGIDVFPVVRKGEER